MKTTFAQVVANSIADFSGTQNTNNWQYGRWVPTGPTNSLPGAFTQLGHFTGSSWVVSTTQTNPSLTSTHGHPGFSGAHVGDWAVRRYTSEVTGVVTLSGTLQHTQTGGGDGTAGRLYLNNRPVYVQLTPANPSVAGPIFNYSTKLFVNSGDVLDLAIDDRGNASFDLTAFNLSVTTVPNTRVVADSFRDFSGTQNHASSNGAGTWQYGHYTTLSNPATFSTAGWTFSSGQWSGPAGTSILVQSAVGGHPDGSTAGLEPVRRWTSTTAGEININGFLRRNNEDTAAIGSGDGIVGRILQNGVQIFEAQIGAGFNLNGTNDAVDNNSRFFDLVVNAAIGDRFDFMVSRNGPGAGDNFNYDGFDFGITITQLQVPEPASIATWGIAAVAVGIVGWRSRRRRTT